jgi:guanosine-3',5'-bis(diphosphate) 3'-pyrophosphohydrolase
MDDVIRLLEAVAFAERRHRGQSRKDAARSPYIGHPIAVARVLATVGGVRDPEMLMAAILHDTVEDTDTTFAELEARFGERVTSLVRELTDDKSLPKAERKQRQVEHAAASSAEAKQLKMADKICNLEDLHSAPPADWPAEGIEEYRRWAVAVVAGCRGVNQALEERFDEVVG